MAFQENEHERILRHRQTEALRRQRIKAVVEEFRHILNSPKQDTQADVLEAALELTKSLLTNNDLTQTTTSSSSSSSPDDFHDITNDSPRLDVLELEFSMPSSAFNTTITESSSRVCDEDPLTFPYLEPVEDVEDCTRSSCSTGANISADQRWPSALSVLSQHRLLTMDVGLVLLGADRKLLDCNSYILALSGAEDRSMLANVGPFDISLDPDIVAQAFNMLERECDSMTVVHRVRSPLGPQWSRVSITRYHDGSDCCYIGIVRIAP
eukprot:TRINITY_DN9158_c0_g2_i1.p1 TRINITY_DN9158_c0_g2~~TRINITY_DN9158_c0_g2_i1.p1  ORF type:complete len:267 (+),score=43.82 TRINITY_DN9158_c0_g2_i1:89-889(+)